MKKAQKENPDRNGKQNNKLLTKEERENCDEFRSCRYRYGMTQEEWAEKIGISLGLVKRIETYTIAYSKKTREKVDKFMETYETYPNIPNMHELEELILYDIFFTHMQQLSKKEAMNYAQECTQSLRDTLFKASQCSTPDAQKIFFDLVNTSLKNLSQSAASAVDATDKGTDCMTSTDDLVSTVKQKDIKTINKVDSVSTVKQKDIKTINKVDSVSTVKQKDIKTIDKVDTAQADSKEECHQITFADVGIELGVSVLPGSAIS